jgi:DNA-directed RNA polymerase specialized sigma24 family protein
MDSDTFARIDRIVANDLRALSQRYAVSLGETADDLYQDCRIHAIHALSRYDYTRGHGYLRQYLSRCLRSYLSTRYKSQRRSLDVMTRLRPGRTELFTEDGEQALNDATIEPLEIDDLIFERRSDSMVERLKEQLRPRELAVYSCLHEPVAEFQAFVRNRCGEDGSRLITLELVGEYLGLGSNAVDWCVHGINGAFTRVLEADFGELVDRAANALKWPMIYLTEERWDSVFIAKHLERLKLDPRPVADAKSLRRGQASMYLETYSWGSVVFLDFEERSATAIVVGRFNLLTGEVIAPGGYWKSMKQALDWYAQALRELRGK